MVVKLHHKLAICTLPCLQQWFYGNQLCIEQVEQEEEYLVNNLQRRLAKVGLAYLLDTNGDGHGLA